MAIQRISGKTSELNSTDALLGIAGVFTGVFEEVIAFSCINIAVLSDVSSAVDGLSFQWSTDGINVDAEDLTSVFAGVGIAFPISVSARFFRVKYTNGGVGQATFRLGVTLREDGTAMVAKALDKPLLGAQFGQVTRAVATGKKADGTYIPNVTNIHGYPKMDTSGTLKRLFDIGVTTIYMGYAANGSSTAAAVWTIRKTALVAGNPTSELWTTEGTAIWDNRATETYS